MIEAAFTFGVVIFVGGLALLVACPPWLKRFLIRHHLLTALMVTAVATAIHWGTMTGLMAAAICGLMASGALGIARLWWRP